MECSTITNTTGLAGLTTEILVIDDDRLIREMLSYYLTSQGYAVVARDNGQAGIDRCRESPPGAVLCDLRMPNMDGLAVLAALHGEFPDLPVIVVSGTGDMSDAIAALKLGAADFVTKPIEDFAVLDHAVGKALERVRLQVENRAYRATLEAANARLAQSLSQLEADEASGRQIQFALLPQREVRFGSYECSRHLATSAILSGDFVDYFSIDEDHFGFYMADVSGHGVSSAVITVLLKCYVGRYLENHRHYGDPTIRQPDALLAALNQELLVGDHGKYLTMFYGVVALPEGRLDYANGGQFPFPLLYNGEVVREIGGRSPPVGLFESARYSSQSLMIPTCFSLRLFSDGALELLSETALQSKKDLLSQLAADNVRDARQLAEALGLGDRQDLPDDVSVLSLRRIDGYA
jgi:sigma-B regulation protein RsbU (phosphoserine phosphatase)